MCLTVRGARGKEPSGTSVPVLLVQETEMGSLKVPVAEKMPPCETQASRERSNLCDGLWSVSAMIL